MKNITGFFLLIFLGTLGAPAQISSSVIRGTVTDLRGDPLKGAKVIATHVPSGTLYADLSDAAGTYRLPGMEVGGPYRVNVTQVGYKPYQLENIYITLNQVNRIDVKLLGGSGKGGIREHVVVVLSMDGFRWDFPKIYHTPNLDRLARSGCKAVALKSSYPTKTFPNHYAIATGLYPDHNGIVQNSFYDKKLNRSFRMGDRAAVEDSIFWEGEAIWETAEQQGVKTAAYFWVGTESNERYRPELSKPYESGFPYAQQIDTVYKWLSLPPADRPKLIMFYFDEPDKTSHSYGPVSKETNAEVTRLDKIVGKLVAGIDRIEKEKGMDIDLIILSDHGMSYVPADHQIFLEDIIDPKKINRFNGGSPVINLDPEPAYFDEAYKLLKATPNLKTWKLDELPARYHYGTNPRISGLIVEADSSYGVEIRRKAQGHYSLGNHGYDPDNTDMQGIFYATGPSFKKGYVQPVFENINIYELLARLLWIKPAKTDGSMAPVKGMLLGN